MELRTSGELTFDSCPLDFLEPDFLPSSTGQVNVCAFP
jgi:hypothetical protein